MKLALLTALLTLSLAAPLLHANNITYLPSTAEATTSTIPTGFQSQSVTLNDPAIFGAFQRTEIAADGAGSTINTNLNPAGTPNPLIYVNNEFAFSATTLSQAAADSQINFTLDNPALVTIDGLQTGATATVLLVLTSSLYDTTDSLLLYNFSSSPSHTSVSFVSPTFTLQPGITYQWNTSGFALNPDSSPPSSSSANFDLNLDFISTPEPTSLLFLAASLPLILRRRK